MRLTLGSLGRARTLLFEVPRNAKLAYCLMRDDRVPLAPKVLLCATLGLVASPLDAPAWVPVIGDLDALALGALAVKVFVDACPEQVVEEHRASVKRGDSAFDRDLRAVAGLGGGVLRRLSSRWRAWRAGGPSREIGVLEDEPA